MILGAGYLLFHSAYRNNKWGVYTVFAMHILAYDSIHLAVQATLIDDQSGRNSGTRSLFMHS